MYSVSFILLMTSFFIFFIFGAEPIEVSPNSYKFETLKAGQISKPVVFKVKNILGKDIVFGTVHLSGKDALDFKIGKDTCSYVILKNSASCEVEVFFNPIIPPPIGKNEEVTQIKVKKQSILIFPVSEVPDFNNPKKIRVPIEGTAIFEKKKGK